MEKSYQFCYTELDDESHLSELDIELLRQAKSATAKAYCPYSRFQVGAALRLANGVVVIGNNQENMAYPSGMCAERVAMYAASAQYPDIAFDTMALIARDSGGHYVEAAPCGACRQVMVEYARRHGRKMRLILYTASGKIRCFNDVEELLPFSFNADL